MKLNPVFMLRMMLLMVSLVFFLTGCDLHKRERTRMQAKMDSLQKELITSREATAVLREVAVLMDSIDISRNQLKTRMLEGTSYEDYSNRMHDINHFVRDAQVRMIALEELNKKLRGANFNYSSSIKILKQDLEMRDQQLTAMKEQVDHYRDENDNLIQTVNLQKAEIADKLGKIRLHEGKVDSLSVKVNDLLAEARTDQADAYFLRAQAIEEVANHTRFAPRKKRDTRREALELYKKAILFGKVEAEQKAKELERKIGA